MFICSAGDSGMIRSTGNVPIEALALKQKGFSKSGFDAITVYKEALKIYPEYDTVYNNIGVEWSLLGYKKTAIDFYNKAIEINPKYAKAYFNRANLRYDIFNDTIGAIEDYHKAIKCDIDNSYVSPYNNLSVIYQRQGDSINELAIMKRGIEICRNNPDELFFVNYAKTLYNADLYWRALDICNEGLLHFPKSGDLHYLKATSYRMVDDLLSSLISYAKAAELGNEDAIKMMNKIKGK